MNRLGHLAGLSNCYSLYSPVWWVSKEDIVADCIFPRWSEHWSPCLPALLEPDHSFIKRWSLCHPPWIWWVLVTALPSGRSDAVSLPRLGHKNALPCDLGTLGSKYQAVKSQTGPGRKTPQHSHMYVLWSMSTSHLTSLPILRTNCQSEEISRWFLLLAAQSLPIFESSQLSPQTLWSRDKPFPLCSVQIPDPPK